MTYDQALAHLELCGWEPHSPDGWCGVFRADECVWSFNNARNGIAHETSQAWRSLSGTWADIPKKTAVAFCEYIIKEGL